MESESKMAEQGSRDPATEKSAMNNVLKIGRKDNGLNIDARAMISQQLRNELREKGLQGFRRGGKVKKTGVYKLHKGEKVLTRRQALYGKGD